MQILRDRACMATNSSASMANGGPSHNSNGSTPNAAAASRASEQLGPLRRQMEAQIGRSRSLQADVRHCRGQLSAERNRCQDLENRLADKEAEIDILRKRQFRVCIS
jgi:septal ring factor EnvC (AmiA/AmiB activator)